MRLRLDFEDVPYLGQLAATRKRVLSRPQRVYGQGKTTRQVAHELEARYKIVEKFVEVEKSLIDSIVKKALLKAHKDGEQVSIPQNDLNRIEARFRQNLAKRKYDGLISGVPTVAAQRGVSHKYIHPFARRASRPSFIDTGLYQRSFRAWVEK
jgi:hypothetical protein